MSGRDLVTGGAGFIGSHIAEALVRAGRKVRVVDNLSTGSSDNLAALDVETVEGDLADPEVAAQACAGVERVFHLAARPSVPFSVAEPELARRANLTTTESLIGAATAAGVRRVVFSSSSAIYGDTEVLPKHEDMEPQPKSPYAEHKLQGERALAAASGLESVSLRYFNVYGPRQDPSSPYSGVIALFARWAREGTDPTIYGDGSQTRDFVYVADVVRANLLAAEVPLPQHAVVVNIARGERVTITELWQQVCAAAGATPVDPTYLPERPGDVQHSLASVVRAAEILGFRAATSLSDGLRETLGG